jgi:hypothetical protein
MQIIVWALVCLILSSTLASGDCCIQTQEDESVPQQFDFTAFRWDGNNTTCPQKVTDEESKALLESLLDSSWVGNNTIYLQRVPDEKAEAVLGDLKPSIQKEYATYIFFLAPWDPVFIVVDYFMLKWLAKKAKAKTSVGSSGFTCKCGVDYTKAMHMQDCCVPREDAQGVHLDGNCEPKCRDICASQWLPKERRWDYNICNKHTI